MKILTLEQKQQRLSELRELWRLAKTPVDRKIIERRAWMIKKTLHTLI